MIITDRRILNSKKQSNALVYNLSSYSEIDRYRKDKGCNQEYYWY